jgi:hypothetical protein
MNLSTVVIENFLDNPDKVRQSVLEIPFERQGPFPGIRSERADDDYVLYTKQKIESVLNMKIKEFKQDSHCFQLCFSGSGTWIHHDDTEWAGVLYLTPDAPIDAGTAIYRHRETKIFKGPSSLPINDDKDWEMITTVGNIYNRLVLYNGHMYHRSVISGFGDDKQNARLTQVYFFNTDK